MKRAYLILAIMMAIVVTPIHAKDRLKLDTTVIKGNKEMPQIVYIVPWKDMKEKHTQEQTLVLHSLFGDLFDPMRKISEAKSK